MAKSLAEYVKSEVVNANVLNENTSQLGYTDVFEGSPYMGPHRHDYLIWNEFGYGYTSDAIADPNKQSSEFGAVCGHIHQIINGVVWPAGDGHTHSLEKPLQIAPDVHIGDCKCSNPCCDQPQVQPSIVFHGH